MGDNDQPAQEMMMMMSRRVPWYAALGGLIGAIIGALIMWLLFHCGCPVIK
jgi:hypothetical protein